MFFHFDARFKRVAGVRQILWVYLLLSISGCATMVASSGIGSVDSIPSGLRRQDLRQRFGEPVSTDTSAAGRAIEVFHIRRKLNHYPLKTFENEMACLTSGWCFFLWPFLLGGTVSLSEANRIHVAFVYDSEGRAVYHFALNDGPSARFVQATRGLPNPLLNVSDFERCANLTPCMTAYVAETRRRADEVGYTIESDGEESFSVALRLARDIDERKITREDAVAKLPRANLAGCVADYISAVRKRAAELGYLPNAQDEEFFAEELSIARDADAGEISRELAHGRLLSESTRHLIKLYQNQDTVGPSSRQLYDAARPLTDALLKKIDENRCHR